MTGETWSKVSSRECRPPTSTLLSCRCDRCSSRVSSTSPEGGSLSCGVQKRNTGEHSLGERRLLLSVQVRLGVRSLSQGKRSRSTPSTQSKEWTRLSVDTPHAHPSSVSDKEGSETPSGKVVRTRPSPSLSSTWLWGSSPLYQGSGSLPASTDGSVSWSLRCGARPSVLGRGKGSTRR